MKLAVLNFSGNVGKTTIARHLLVPRIDGAELVAVESLNADGTQGQVQSLRGREFGELQEYLQTVVDVVVDIGASNIEDLLSLMRKYQGSHEDFDYFVVPTVPALKQQEDTIATLAELARLGVPASRVRVVFNMVEDGVEVAQAFELLLSFLRQHPVAQPSVHCRLGTNEVFGRLKAAAGPVGSDLRAVALDPTDYKKLIAEADDIAEKLRLAQALATRRLARGVVPELDTCFAALDLAAHPT